MTWLLDTLIWTGVLIALILVIRRPVARLLGAKAAYALWILPFLRLVLPPFTLPAWMKPESMSEVQGSNLGAVPDVSSASLGSIRDAAGMSFQTGGVGASASADFALFANVDWSLFAVAVWLTGAALFIYLRVRSYRKMRDILLSNAIEMGEVDDIRIVETPLTEAPIAFGVQDKVVAVPEGFLDREDRDVRDLALKHEFAHHRSHDLLANFMVQPLFALHWFNPLAWMGWRAMRSDQEAACDGRVVEECTADERARYAEVIAGFATGPRLTLAAPMACPVLGDKSIIQRLRSLTMNNISSRRRRAGKAGLVVAALALPVTATITYAETLAPKAPSAPSVAVVPLAPPAAPFAPNAPIAPEAPLAPLAPSLVQVTSEVEVEFDEAMQDIEAAERDVQVIVMRDGEGEHKIEKRHIKIVHDGEGEMSAEEREEMMAEVREALAEAKIEMAEAKEEMRVALLEMHESEGAIVKVKTDCDSDEPIREKLSADGKKIMVICKTAIHSQALMGIREARDAIAADTEMDAEIRAMVIETLDAQIENWQREG